MQRDAQQRIETLQTSLDHRLGLYTAHREESPRENGRLGGRPKKQSEGFHASRDVQQVFDR